MAGNHFVNVLWSALRRDKLALTGAVVLLVLVAIALFAPFIATHDPNEINYHNAGVTLWQRDGRWESPREVGTDTLVGVALTGNGQAWVVGDNGLVLFFDATRWQAVSTPTDVALQSVAAVDDFAVAVGAGGTILHLEGSSGNPTWQVVSAPTTEDLLGVAIAGRDLAVAVGRAGTVLQWDGVEWQAINSGTREHLHGVSMLDDGYGFIVGARSTVLAFDNGRVSRQNVLGFRNFYDVHILDRSNAIAVGERGTIFGFNGRMWQQMFGSETRDLSGVRIVEPGSAIAIGSHGVVMSLQSNQWRRVDVDYRRNLRGIDVGDGTVLVVGTDPYVNELAPPSRQHYFGTTHLGRDIFSQTIYGSRTALLVGVIAAIMVTIIGTNVGLFAGYFRGRVDNILMRIVDVMYALPFEPFAMVLVMIFRPSLAIVILAVGLLTWRSTARIIRAQVLSLANRPFVKAARTAGASNLRTLYVHIAPNVLPLALLQLAVSMAFAITAEATLSFLGLGPPQTYSWGTILHAARLSGAWRVAWWWVIPPGLLIMITVVSVFFISRALEVITNPRLEGGK